MCAGIVVVDKTRVEDEGVDFAETGALGDGGALGDKTR